MTPSLHLGWIRYQFHGTSRKQITLWYVQLQLGSIMLGMRDDLCSNMPLQSASSLELHSALADRQQHDEKTAFCISKAVTMLLPLLSADVGAVHVDCLRGGSDSNGAQST